MPKPCKPSSPCRPGHPSAFGEIEALLMALGAEKTEREGSRVKFTLRGVEWHAHRPHPGKEAKKYQVERVRECLATLEIKP